MAAGPGLDMGRYAVFVWPAYGLSALVLIGAVIQTLIRAHRWRRAAERDANVRRDEQK